MTHLRVLPNRFAEREKLCLLCLDLVTMIAKHVGARLPPCFDIDDLAGPGFVGLVRARDSFSFDREDDDTRTDLERFKAYARRWIHGSILESVRRRNWREAHHVHIEDMGWDTADDAQGAAMYRMPESLIEHRQNPEPEAEAREREERIDSAMELLDDRSHKVVSIRLADDAPMTHIAKRLGCSPSRAAQILRSSHNTMKLRLVA